MNINKTNIKGLSLIEILIVISVFAIIGILSSTSLFLTLRNAKKSESLVKVKENLNYSLAVIERQIRNSEKVDCTTSTNSVLNYIALEGVQSSFSCKPAVAGNTAYIASGSARLTPSNISVSSCAFTCTETSNNPPSVKVSLTFEDAVSTAPEKASITTETEIVTRNY